MSLSKLEKYLDKPIESPQRLSSRPILVTSSKGFSLLRNLDLIKCLGFELEINCWPGANFNQTYNWLKSNLAGKQRNYGDITLYIWIGTCDLTSKKGKFIDLAQNSDNECEEFIHFQIDRIVSFVKNFSTVKLIFLDIPPYSIVSWNTYKGHQCPDLFIDQDRILDGRITLLNNYIQEVDQHLGVKSLNFRADLLKYKRKGRKPVVNFDLFKDGVHPGRVLARVWMRRFVTKIFHDCV